MVSERGGDGGRGSGLRSLSLPSLLPRMGAPSPACTQQLWFPLATAVWTYLSPRLLLLPASRASGCCWRQETVLFSTASFVWNKIRIEARRTYERAQSVGSVIASGEEVPNSLRNAAARKLFGSGSTPTATSSSPRTSAVTRGTEGGSSGLGGQAVVSTRRRPPWSKRPAARPEGTPRSRSTDQRTVPGGGLRAAGGGLRAHEERQTVRSANLRVAEGGAAAARCRDGRWQSSISASPLVKQLSADSCRCHGGLPPMCRLHSCWPREAKFLLRRTHNGCCACSTERDR